MSVKPAAAHKQHIATDCVLWAPDAARRLLIIPHSPGRKFRLAVDTRGDLARHAGPPAADTTFGVALAAKRLRQTAEAAAPDVDGVVMSFHGGQAA